MSSTWDREAEKPEEAREFDRLGYRFVSGQSDENTYVFVRQKN